MIGGMIGLVMLLSTGAVDATPYDGRWAVTDDCPATAEALGFTHRFDARVTDGTLPVENGVPNNPAYLSLDGHIPPSGATTLVGHGLTGSTPYDPGRVAPMTAFQFPVDVHFTPTFGSGIKTAIRPCTLSLQKY